jgi:abortive infection bacteriophage resistance protein
MKEFKTHRQQLRILRERGLTVPKNGVPKKVLLEENYYSLINGYSSPFLDQSNGESKYKPGSTFNEIHSLYLFDRELKTTLFKYIISIETKIKSIVTYTFTESSSDDKYLKISSFENYIKVSVGKNKKEKQTKDITGLILKLQEDITYYYTKKDYIKHYLNNYGYIPLWVLVNCLSFGVISKFYSLMKDNQRIKVSKHFGLHQNSLKQYIRALAEARNLCAHDERLYNVQLRNDSKIIDTSYHVQLNIIKNKGNFTQGKDDFFAIVISLKDLLPKRDFKKFFNEVNKEISSLEKQLKSINIDAITSSMGLPSNWRNILNM